MTTRIITSKLLRIFTGTNEPIYGPTVTGGLFGEFMHFLDKPTLGLIYDRVTSPFKTGQKGKANLWWAAKEIAANSRMREML